MIVLIALLVIGAIFFHGQALDTKLPVRAVSTGVVALVMGYLTYILWNSVIFACIGAVNTAIAFCWGPEIGWNKDVRRTQAIKGAWLMASLFPFNLLYAALRPLAYWVGYTKYVVNSDRSDEVSRLLSGVFLAIICAMVEII